MVTRSSALEENKRKKLQRVIAQEREALQREIKALKRQRFSCEEDAQAAWQRFQNEHQDALHPFKGWVIAFTEVKRPPGRPRRDVDYPRITYYTIDVNLYEPTEEGKQAWLERASAFVLIANLPEDAYSDTNVLEEYKDQEKVEPEFPQTLLTCAFLSPTI